MITITESASVRIKEMIKENEEKEGVFLRFGVSGGGCSGLSYVLHFVEEKTEEDTFVETNDIQVLIHTKDVPIVKDTVIDYKENLLGGGFIINNPNAIVTCGCGSSFRTKAVSGTPEDC